MCGFISLSLVFFAGTCLAESINNKIVGGELAVIEDYPSLVQIDFLSSTHWYQSCAGSILNELYVLSAAHCFEGDYYSPSLRRVRAGATYRNSGGVIVSIVTENNHPDYGVAASLDADISVIRLSSYLTLSSTVQRSNIPVQDAFVPADLDVWLVGWGTTSDGGPSSSVLLSTQVTTVDNEACRQLYALRGNDVTPNMICTHYANGGRDSCQGDSGGPVYWGQATVAIISWGASCAHNIYPGVNTAIAPYTNWIIDIARRA